MKYLVYLTICNANNKIYVGVHETENPDIFDNYLGNGVYINRPASYKKQSTPFKKAVAKYGVNAFYRITIAVFENKIEAYDLEKQIVTLEFIKRKDTYNIKLGGSGGAPESQKIPIYMYDSNGSFVKEFESLKECVQEINPGAPNGSHISRAIKLGRRVKGFQFSYEKHNKLDQWKFNMTNHVNNLPKTPYNKENKPIGRYNMNDELLQTYACLADVKKDGYKNAKFVILGKRNHCKGFKFKYIE